MKCACGFPILCVVLVGLAGVALFAFLMARSPEDTGTAMTPAEAKASEARFVNDRCPIMGAKIDPQRVPAALTREFGGEKVAFCCAGCPTAWDELGEAEKAEKLHKVRIHASQ